MTDKDATFERHKVASAAEQARALLDAREVEWTRQALAPCEVTVWSVGDTRCEFYDALGVARLTMVDLTPEQAVDATLGRGECKVEGFADGCEDIDGRWHQYYSPKWRLSCGHTVESGERPHYCVSCGRKVSGA